MQYPEPKRFFPDHARQGLEELRQLVGDPEAAHAAEDDLRAAVLAAIASGYLTGEDAIQAADLALSTTQVEFARWYA